MGMWPTIRPSLVRALSPSIICSFLCSLSPASPARVAYTGARKAFCQRVSIPTPCVLLPRRVTWLLVIASYSESRSASSARAAAEALACAMADVEA